MTARRSLVAGLNTPENLDPNAVRSFVKQDSRPSDPPKGEPVEFSAPFDKKKPAPKPEATKEGRTEAKRTVPKRNKNKLMPVALIPVTVRLRPEIAGALKRASLERQLSGEDVYTQQDLVELALEPWLQEQGYL